MRVKAVAGRVGAWSGWGVLGRVERRSVVAGLLVVALVAGVVVAAVEADGFRENRVDLHEGGIWVTKDGWVGRLNTQIASIEWKADASADRVPDVAQLGAEVLVFGQGSRVWGIDQAAGVQTGEVSVPSGSTVLLAAGAGSGVGGQAQVAMVAHPLSGRVWLGDGNVVAGPQPAETKATLTLPGWSSGAGDGGGSKREPAAVALSPGGTGYVYGPGSKVVHAVSPGGETRKLDLGGVARSAQVATVGEQVVVLDTSGGTLLVPGREPVRLGGLGSMFALQEAGPSLAGSEVLVASEKGLWSVPISGSSPRQLVRGGGGEPVRPVVAGGCAYGAWREAPTWGRACAGESLPQRTNDVPRPSSGRGMRADASLRFRVNHDRAVLNDVRGGAVLTVYDDEPQVINDWEAAFSDDEVDKEDPALEVERSDKDDCPDTFPAPAVKADAGVEPFGTRPGRPVVVPVLDRVEAHRCDVLRVESPDWTPASAEVVVVGGGSALQVHPMGVESGVITVNYQVVGSDPDARPVDDQITVVVYPPGENRLPVPNPDETTVAAGKEVRHDVLRNDTDPEGDPLILVSAEEEVESGRAVGVVRPRSDGTITYVAPPGTAATTTTIRYLVTDDASLTQDGSVDPDGGVSEGFLTVYITPQGQNVRPKANNDRADVYLAKPGGEAHPTTVDLLANDTDANGDRLQVTEVVNRVPGLQVDRVPGSGVVRLAAGRGLVAGTYRVQYRIKDDSTGVAAGWIRVDVHQPTGNTAPVAVRDDLLLRPGVPAMVDLTANDIDIDGDPLAITKLGPVDAEAARGISVELLEMRVARVTAPTGFQGSVAIPYRVSDGSETTNGALVVHPFVTSADNIPPLAADDAVAVRAGNTTAIDVLRNDSDPEGEELTIKSVEPVPAEDGQVFIQEDQLRFLAAGEVRHRVSVTYTIVDPGGATDTGRVDIDIAPPDQNQPPRPVELVGRVQQGRTVRIAVPLVGLDPEGDPTVLGPIVADHPPRLGVVEVEEDTFVYEANPSLSGVDDFRFTTVDSNGEVGSGRVRVVVTKRPTDNSPPVAVADKVTVLPNTSRAIDVLANDSDPDGDDVAFRSRRVGAVGGPSKPTSGSLSVDDNLLVFDAEGEGLSTFTYEVTDGRGGTARGLVTVTVSTEEEPNVPPVARDVTLQPLKAGTYKTIDLAAMLRIWDPDDPRGELYVDVPNASGVTVDAATLRIKVGPKTRSFLYRVRDAREGEAWAVITVPVLEVPDDPEEQELLAPRVGNDGPFDAIAGEQLSISAADLLANDQNPNKTGTITIARLGSGPGGTPELLDNGGVGFVPAADFSGQASFSYQAVVRDGKRQSPAGVGQVTVFVTGAETKAPTCTNTDVVIPAGQELDVSLLALSNDEDSPRESLTFRGERSGADSISFTLRDAALVVKTGDLAEGDSAAYTYTADDGENTSTPCRVGVKVSEFPADPPVASSKTARTTGNKRVAIDALAGNVDPYGKGLDLISVSVAGGAATGTAVIDGGTVTFEPGPGTGGGFFGTARLTYLLRDKLNRDATGIIEVTVIGRPGAPTKPLGQVGSKQVELTWGAPPANGGQITGYVVEVGGAATKTQQFPSNTGVVTGLTNASEYRFRVAALSEAQSEGDIDPDRWSPWSDPQVPDQKPDQPPAPTVEFRANDNNGGAGGVLHVSWSPGTVDGSPILQYRLQGGPTEITIPAGQTSRTVTGLTNGTSYTFILIAENRVGPSEPSTSSRSETPAGVPGPVNGVTAERLNDPKNNDGGWAKVAWAEPQTNGDAVTEYTVQSGSRTETVASATTLEFGGLDVNGTHTFQVKAKNKAGYGQPGTTSPSTGVDGQPRGVNATATPEDGGIRLDNISVSDTRGSAAVFYEAGTFTEMEPNWVRVTSGTRLPFPNGSTTQVAVRACKQLATLLCSEWWTSANITPFGPPTGLNATVTDRTITWNWDPIAPGVDTHEVIGQSGGESCGATCYRQTFGYAETRCIAIRASGQGVTQTSAEKCATTDARVRPTIGGIDREYVGCHTPESPQYLHGADVKYFAVIQLNGNPISDFSRPSAHVNWNLPAGTNQADLSARLVDNGNGTATLSAIFFHANNRTVTRFRLEIYVAGDPSPIAIDQSRNDGHWITQCP